MAFKKILVPVDFSEFSFQAVECALYLAEQYGARITLLHSILLFQEEIDDETQLREYEELVKKKERESYEELQRHYQKAKERGVSIDSKILRGFSAADTILEFIQNSDYDLVVMGTHGRTGIKKWLYGSVAEKIVRLSPIPVLTTHLLSKPFAIRSLLVPVDFSEFSLKAIEFAKETANIFSASITYLHVVSQDYHPTYFSSGGEGMHALDPEMLQKTREKLKDFSEDDSAGARFEVITGKPYQGIVEHAREYQIDLIVMATRGLTGLEHLLIGSTTERVVRLAECPVLTIERSR